jgi:hypothetical protein
MLQDVPQLDTLVVPVGGGGMIAGCAVAARGLKPDIKVIGVESAGYSAMRQLLAGEPVTAGGDTIAEGIAVRDIGKLPLSLCGALLDRVVAVGEIEIEHAIALLLEIEKTVAEGAGATGLAALLAYPDLFTSRKVGLVLSGGNIDTRLLASVLMRGLVRDGRIVPPAPQDHRRAGTARARRQHHRQGRRQYRRGPASAPVRRRGRQGRRSRCHRRDARPPPYGRAGLGAEGLTASPSECWRASRPDASPKIRLGDHQHEDGNRSGESGPTESEPQPHRLIVRVWQRRAGSRCTCSLTRQSTSSEVRRFKSLPNIEADVRRTKAWAPAAPRGKALSGEVTTAPEAAPTSTRIGTERGRKKCPNDTGRK